MKRDEIPMMIDVLNQAKQSEAVGRACLWALARLTFALRSSGVLRDQDIDDAFDPNAIGSSISEQFQDIAKQAIDHLRNQSLGRSAQRH